MKKENLFFENKQEVVNYVLTHEYNAEMHPKMMCAYLIVAREMGDTEMVNQIVNDLSLLWGSMKAVNGVCEHYYRRYGAECLGYCYVGTTRKQVARQLIIAERGYWENISWDFVMRYMIEGERVLTAPSIFINNYLGLRLVDAYSKWFTCQVKKTYKQATRKSINNYTRMRYHTACTMDLDTHDNDEIITRCAQDGFRITANTLNKLRLIFCVNTEDQIACA